MSDLSAKLRDEARAEADLRHARGQIERQLQAAVQSHIGCCRAWVDDTTPCSEPAEFLLWGKLLPSVALGPRCYEHAKRHVGDRALSDPDYAILSVRRLVKALMEELP